MTTDVFVHTDPVVANAPERPEAFEPDAWGLCLSGGGYRAMLFHVGVLWRLNELGVLPKLARISSVSGGSITAGVLGTAWRHLAFDANGVSPQFQDRVVAPLRALAGRTLDVPAAITGLVPFFTAGGAITRAYRTHLFGDATLQDLPDTPRFVINATHVKTGALFRFSKPYMADWKFGRAPNPRVALALAVAASSAFPPFLSPINLPLTGTGFVVEPEAVGLDPGVAVLTDGGVYDNLGLETVWKRCGTILVSDGGAQFGLEKEPSRLWPLQAYRALAVMDSQVRALRVRQLIGAFIEGRRRGAYLGIRSRLDSYPVPPCADGDRARGEEIASEQTRLKALHRQRIDGLIRWGYCVCDSGMRAHVKPNAPVGRAPQ